MKRHHLSSSDVLPKFRTAKELRRHEMFGNALIQFGDEIARYLLEIRKEYFQTGSPTELAYKVHDIVRELRRISWAFPLKLKEESLSTIDRTKPLLGGPLFTSKEYPWPELGGSLAEPIAQIDLKHASRLGSVGLGAGLLQLWVESHSDLYTVRVIQSSELMVENLSALPEELSERASGFASHSDWLETKMACRIIGHQKKLVSWPDTLKSKIEDILPLLRKEHCDRLLDFLKCIQEEVDIDAPHLFGTFRSIQYTAAERPNCLLALESDVHLGWGDGGSAQIFYSPRSNGSVKFTFSWSCG